jgi:hypothetical protein
MGRNQCLNNDYFDELSDILPVLESENSHYFYVMRITNFLVILKIKKPGIQNRALGAK